MKTESPQDLLKHLTAIFPDFNFEPDGYGYDFTDFSYHALLTDFTTFYGSSSTLFSEQQIKACAALVNDSVEHDGDLENAFATCFLEHLGQIGARKPLVAFLSKSAKDRLHA